MASDLIDHNPSLKKPALAVLGLLPASGEGADRAQVEEAAADVWQRSWRIAPAHAVDILVGARAIASTVLVDGEPYAGTMEDLQRDESVSEDAEVACLLALTDHGRQIQADYDPAHTLAALYEAKPAYAEIFDAALAACAAPTGATREQLESAISRFPQLAPDPATGQTRVYPQYFIDALESAGGIAWDGAWRATEAALSR